MLPPGRRYRAPHKLALKACASAVRTTSMDKFQDGAPNGVPQEWRASMPVPTATTRPDHRNLVGTPGQAIQEPASLPPISPNQILREPRD